MRPVSASLTVREVTTFAKPVSRKRPGVGHDALLIASSRSGAR